MKSTFVKFLMLTILLSGMVSFGTQLFAVEVPEENSFGDDTEGVTVNYAGETVPYVPEVEVNIKDVSFDQANRKLSVQTDIKNNTANYLDDLEYVIEIRRGDALAEEGYIFSTTEHTYQEVKNLGKLAPNAVSTKILSIDVPKNIETGNYFVQVFVNDKNLKFQNVDFIEEPILLNGTGGRLSGLKMYFYTTTYGKTAPMVGLSTTPEDKPLILIPLDENVGVDAYVKSARVMKYEMDIYDTLGEKKLIVSSKGDLARKVVDGQDSLFVEIDTASNEVLKKGGPFEIKFSLVNDKDEILFTRNLRWLVEYGQLIARIMNVDSPRNFYKSGDKLEVSSEIVSINGKGNSIIAELHLIGSWGFDQTFSKQVSLDEYGGKIVFDDAVSQRTKLKEMNLVVKDAKTGDVLDSYSMDIKYFKKYGVKNYDMYILIGLLIILVGIFVYLKRKGKIDLAVMIMMVFIPAVMFFGDYQKTEAICACAGGSPTATFWVSREPVTPTCGGTAIMDVTLRVVCGACVNGLQAKITDNAGGISIIDYGHEVNPTRVHRVVKTISTSPTLISATAKFTQNGCHCCPRPGIGDLCQGLPVINGAMCPIDVLIGTLSRSVSCNLPGDCGARNAQRDGNYLATETSWPANSSWCTLGTPSGTPTRFPNPGQTVWWSCLPIPQGTGLGDTCSAARANVSVICGNGIKEGTEQCDDGNTTSGDGCSSVCAIERSGNIVCGNGIKEGTEQCDDGNTTSGDGCSNNCMIENGGDCGTECTLGCPQNCPEGCGTDYICGAGENANTCPKDCEPECENGVCEQGEGSLCPQDCGEPIGETNSFCGDNVCNSNENFLNCRLDCGSKIIEF
ncbi:MAG: myxococcus cysteine-rich repeat containing protein [Candidatus Pacebacteria bacterium]|nr:myxococcus cysteine-rich repeat containing protein [Candidatus Paceibacterota bacterium]